MSGLQPIVSSVILGRLCESQQVLPCESWEVNKENIVTDLFKSVCPALFPLIADLSLTNSPELRLALREVLLQKVAPLLKL